MCQRAIQLTPEGEKLNRILMILFFVNCVFLILRIVFQRYDILFSSVIASIMLLCAFLMCHYFLLMYLFFFMMFGLFFTIVFLGLRIQNAITGDYDRYLKESFYQAGLGIECFAFIFTCITLYFIYKAYKEYKAITLGYAKDDNSYQPLNESDLERNRNNEANDNNNGSNSVNPSNMNGFKAFSGTGVQLGGS